MQADLICVQPHYYRVRHEEPCHQLERSSQALFLSPLGAIRKKNNSKNDGVRKLATTFERADHILPRRLGPWKTLQREPFKWGWVEGRKIILEPPPGSPWMPWMFVWRKGSEQVEPREMAGTVKQCHKKLLVSKASSWNHSAMGRFGGWQRKFNVGNTMRLKIEHWCVKPVLNSSLSFQFPIFVTL